MPSSTMMVPPITVDLWPALLQAVNTGLMTSALGGANRLYLEGDYQAEGWNGRWGRGVVVPVLPVIGLPIEEGLPVTVTWRFRTDFASMSGPPHWQLRAGQLAQREAARMWWGWDPSEALAGSTTVMVAGRIRLEERWQDAVVADPDQTDTVFLSSAWSLDVASPAD